MSQLRSMYLVAMSWILLHLAVGAPSQGSGARRSAASPVSSIPSTRLRRAPAPDGRPLNRSAPRQDTRERVHEPVDVFFSHRERARAHAALRQQDSFVQEPEEHAG